MTFSLETYSKDFDKTNHELKAYWEMGREAVRNVGIKINELVSILHKEHKDWSISKIAYIIAAANDSLEGFSRKTIYNYLNDDNRALLDPGKQNQKQNNVLEDGGESIHHNVIEDSSNDIDIPTEYNFQNAVIEEPKQQEEEEEEEEEEEDFEDEEEEPEITYDNPDKIIKQYEEQILDWKKKYEELESKSKNKNRVSRKYELKYKDQTIQLKCLFYYDTESFTITVDE